MDHNEQEVSDDMYNFLQAFFTAHGKYLPNEFYVFGESYGGHFVPAISRGIYDGNAKKDGLHINLAGFGLPKACIRIFMVTQTRTGFTFSRKRTRIPYFTIIPRISS